MSNPTEATPYEYHHLAIVCDEQASRIAQLEAALREIAVGCVSEDGAAGEENRYMLCAGRLCAMARAALAPKEPKP